MAKDAGKKKTRKKDDVGRGLYLMYCLFFIISALLVVRLFWIQVAYKPNPELVRVLTPTSKKVDLVPNRGSILSDDGRLLATSLPIYEIHMDCIVLEKRFNDAKEEGNRKKDSLDRNVIKMCEGLASIIGGRSAQEYLTAINNGRKEKKGYVPIASGVERKDLSRLKKLPFFDEDSNRGGIIVECEKVRKYPYGELARRTIGFVRNNKSNVTRNTHVGIEGKFDYVLHGKDGVEYLRIIDNRLRVHDSDSSFRKAENGLDVRTTLNIDFQDIADKALRERIKDEKDIEGGCLVMMEVSTGAIKAMVNLSRDSLTNRLEEVQNFALGRRCEPGSVFKTVTLMSVLSDGYVKSLDETMPTNHGRIPSAKIDDVHIREWEDKHHTNRISVIDGFKISSNYVFSKLALDNYGRKPQKFIDNIYLYKLGEAFEFDIEGLLTPSVPNPRNAGFGQTGLARVGFGYATEETPLHILNFYNAIANKGRMMRPYLVESIEKNGEAVEKKGQAILNGSICSKAVADTLTRALLSVTEEGTGKALKGAAYPVAGKTGTSFAVLSPGTSTPYTNKYGQHKYQGTFVGYFPADDPRYSIICMVYSHPTGKQFQGGGIPASAVREVVDKVSLIDTSWGEVLHKTAQVPQMRDTSARDKNKNR